MIHGLHAIIYTADPDKARAFFRDTLGFKHVDAGRGWLIFGMPPAELAFHPAEDDNGGAEASGETPAMHQVYLMCDDVAATVEELKRKGVEFTRPIADHGWGLLTTMRIPGGGELGLYQPKHPTALGLK